MLRFTKTIRILLRCGSCIFFSIFSFYFSQAQEKKNNIRGSIVDSLQEEPIDSCLIILQLKDQKLQTYSDADGKFIFKNIVLTDSIALSVLHKGYSDYKTIRKKNSSDLGIIYLVPLASMMDSITIKKLVPAVLIKNDTTEYTVDSFAIEKGDMVEDLLRLLPGLEIDENGKITHNGKPINRILVNGEDFFGGDFNISLKNLPAEIVSKIQVMDTKTREQIFNNLESDGQEKTLNIKLKAGLKSFGNSSLTGGTTHLLNANSMVNILSDARGLSILGSASTVSKQGISAEHPSLVSFSRSAGLNYRDNIKKKISVNGSINDGLNNNAQESRRRTQQYFSSDSFFTTNNYSYSNFQNNNHQLNLSVNGDINKTTRIDLGLSYSAGQIDYSNYSETSTFENGVLRNEGIRKNSSSGISKNFISDLAINKRFQKKGRSMSFTMRTSLSDRHSDMLNSTDNIFFSDSLPAIYSVLDQHIFMQGHQQGINLGLAYIEPISKNIRLRINANMELTNASDGRKTYNVDSLSHEEKYDSIYSNNWQSADRKFGSDFSVIYEQKNRKIQITPGLSVWKYFSERKIEGKENISQNELNFSPSLTSSFRISETKYLRFSFSGHSTHPSIDQLQPVLDNSNPLYVRIGNPDLRSSFQQEYMLFYNSASKSGRVISSAINYSPIANSIVNANYYDSYRKIISRFVNVNGIYNISGNWNYSHVINISKAGSSWGMNGSGSFGRNVFFETGPMLYTRNYIIRQSINYARTISGNKRSRFNVAMSASYSRSISPSNEAGINSRTFNFGPNVNWTYSFKKRLELKTSYQLNGNQVNYNVAKDTRTKYVNQNFSQSALVTISKRIDIGTNLIYSYNGTAAFGALRNTYLWNMNASAQMFRNRRGLIKFSAIDILNKNPSVIRTITENYIEDAETSKQKRYFTLSFQYNWTKLDQKK